MGSGEGEGGGGGEESFSHSLAVLLPPRAFIENLLIRVLKSPN